MTLAHETNVNVVLRKQGEIVLVSSNRDFVLVFCIFANRHTYHGLIGGTTSPYY